jgi:hypothetical protein
MDPDRDLPKDAAPDLRLPLTVGLMEKGGNWPGPPTLWQRFVRLLKRRRS